MRAAGSQWRPDITGLFQRETEIAQCDRILRHEANGLAKLLQCAGVISLATQSDTDAFAARAKARGYGNGPPELSERRLHIPGLAKGYAQMIASFDILRPSAQLPTKLRNRLRRLATLQVSESKLWVHVRIIRH